MSNSEMLEEQVQVDVNIQVQAEDVLRIKLALYQWAPFLIGNFSSSLWPSESIVEFNDELIVQHIDKLTSSGG